MRTKALTQEVRLTKPGAQALEGLECRDNSGNHIRNNMCIMRVCPSLENGAQGPTQATGCLGLNWGGAGDHQLLPTPLRCLRNT